MTEIPEVGWEGRYIIRGAIIRRRHAKYFLREKTRRALKLGFKSLADYEAFLKAKVEAEFPSDPKDKPWKDNTTP
jgi:hypothetical protein